MNYKTRNFSLVCEAERQFLHISLKDTLNSYLLHNAIEEMSICYPTFHSNNILINASDPSILNNEVLNTLAFKLKSSYPGDCSARIAVVNTRIATPDMSGIFRHHLGCHMLEEFSTVDQAKLWLLGGN